MKIFGVYIVSNKNEIILSVNNDTDSISSFFPIKKDDPFITSTTMKWASKNSNHIPYKREKKFYYGINDGIGNAYFLVSDIKDDKCFMTLLEQIKEIDLTMESQQQKSIAISIAIKDKVLSNSNESTSSLNQENFIDDLKNGFIKLWS